MYVIHQIKDNATKKNILRHQKKNISHETTPFFMQQDSPPKKCYCYTFLQKKKQEQCINFMCTVYSRRQLPDVTYTTVHK